MVWIHAGGLQADAIMSDRGDGKAVAIPDGRTATPDEMRSCSRRLQQYVRETEARLTEITDAREHDRIVDFLRSVANAYNMQLRIFRAADEERRNTARLLMAVLLADSAYPREAQTRH